MVADRIPPDGYVLAQAWVDYGNTGLTHNAPPAPIWPDLEPATFLTIDDPANNGMQAGGLTDIIDPPASNYVGDLFAFSLKCTTTQSLHTLSIVISADKPAGTSGALYVEFGPAGSSHTPKVTGLQVNCNAGPTNTPTATPPPIPRMSKSPALQNVFLTRQGAKIPPSSCLATKGTTANVGELAEGLNQTITSLDPKDPSSLQQLAAFEFEVHYDNKKVCVDLNEGPAWVAAGAVCIIEDDQPDSKPQLEGVARIGCVTIGKGHGIDELVALATVDIYPQPELYSEMKPNQDNGQVVQINNVDCDLSDEQGHAIGVFSCDDADITFRYLEGDVEPDCVVDALDAQAIAFRWGVEKGSLIYKDFMNLEPSSQQQDNDIDINDLQFVFGRFGSTCEDPHPAQDPVNPKGGATPTPTPTLPTPTLRPKITGDANFDFSVDATDALLVLQFFAGLIDSLPNQTNANANGDSRVDSIDALLIRHVDEGLLNELPPTQETPTPFPFQPTNPEVAVGSDATTVGSSATVDLSVSLLTWVGLGAWAIDVKFDPGLVDATGCTSLDVPIVCNPEYQANRVRVAGVDPFGASGVGGVLNLAAIEFDCLAAGSAVLEVLIEVFRSPAVGYPQQLSTTTLNGSITCV